MKENNEWDIGEGLIASEYAADCRDDAIRAESEIVEMLQHILERVLELRKNIEKSHIN